VCRRGRAFIWISYYSRTMEKRIYPKTTLLRTVCGWYAIVSFTREQRERSEFDRLENYPTIAIRLNFFHPNKTRLSVAFPRHVPSPKFVKLRHRMCSRVFMIGKRKLRCSEFRTSRRNRFQDASVAD